MKQSWEMKKFEDCLEKVVYTKKIQRKDFLDVGEYPIVSQEQDFINGFWNISDDLFQIKKPIVIFGDHTQVIKYVDFDFVLGADGVKILQPKNSIDSRFFYYFLKTVNLGNLGYARHYRLLKEIKVSYPKSISKQKHIVAILDEAFAAIAKAKANAEKNLKNAKELFESYLQGVFENKGEGWEEKALGDIADVEYGYTDNATEKGYYRYIRITDIDKKGELILENKKYIKHSKESENFIIKNKDLLMARTGATFAKVLLFNDNEPSVFASYLIRINFKVEVQNELYWYFSKTRKYWDQANSLQSGSAQPHFNGAAVKQVFFPYPKAVKEQKQLIEKFQTLLTKTNKLEEIYHTKINNLEELKKTILQKAFSGELTKTEVALA